MRKQKTLGLPATRAAQLHELAVHFQMDMSDLLDDWIRKAWNEIQEVPKIPGFVLERSGSGENHVILFGIDGANPKLRLTPEEADGLGEKLIRHSEKGAPRVVIAAVCNGSSVTCARQGRGYQLNLSSTSGQNGGAGSTTLTRGLLYDIGAALRALSRPIAAETNPGSRS